MEESLKKALIEDAMIVMSGDMFQRIYEKDDIGWVAVTNIIKSWARQFVERLIERGYKGDGDDELDFIIELEKFETVKFEAL